mgnify:CR=1 FL=1
MQDKFVQAIRYKLQKRVRRLNSADYAHFLFLLRSFLRYVDDSPILSGARDELLARAARHNPQTTVDQILGGEAQFAEAEDEAAAVGYLLLRAVADTQDQYMQKLTTLGRIYGAENKFDEHVEKIRDLFLEPFYEYIDEHIDDQQAILYVLRRYKHHCEWFHAEQLHQLVENDTTVGEASLAKHLYEFLHREGIEFHIEPKSHSGIADFVAEQVGDERVVADAKIFWPEKSKGKQYLISAFHQVYTYSRDYNESCAYLVVFKMCAEDVHFLVPQSTAMFPSVSMNNKTIFFVVVDICAHAASASKRGALKSIEVREEELIQVAADSSSPWRK